ncbi:paraquat-inducible protein A [Nitratidesulfovibrio vulgaris]|jgi:paraquat-inducible protein A|uniref:Paraquat-inducible protein A n=1 Tax=Nitratidesulfovibrio vulgaris (strain DP4) TaxID=391774 RepID=A0A0H3A5K0_NITV4|nr:paraquat-inducible protein A [Nitratidesulfovibrio vulgaris]GEB78603.1 paraquat-inducible protein [Desulfovibrio desulfuricans]HBW17053.1 paraquat-inducible protein A [Desulfovibrio sp.]ABM27282.1 Paraquat-inducible protein A [Nitratidesulfovibrio vulgaris DP4]ADP88029.1 Paraquat-inducible protein A [Nitratidesulfovibrio vulgaris RCH1]WCB46481.1 paraquat-inducible protein A [Nitratidesulfovibrio vulgaris]
MKSLPTSAKSLGLLQCHDCHLLIRSEDIPAHHAHCPRCGAPLHFRKPDSIARTWALLLAASIMYIPANLLPMTVTTAVGAVQTDTIMSGVIYFIHSGSWEIAAVIFIASIFVPLVKLAILVFLLVSVQRRSKWRPRDRTVLYRITELVGRWSMVDVYVVTILVALVKLGAVASIEAGPAAVYFASVVVLTMLAAESFDPRIIWDVIEDHHDR